MNIAQIENNLQLLVNSFDEHTFIYELLLAIKTVAEVNQRYKIQKALMG